MKKKIWLILLLTALLVSIVGATSSALAADYFTLYICADNANVERIVVDFISGSSRRVLTYTKYTEQTIIAGATVKYHVYASEGYADVEGEFVVTGNTPIDVIPPRLCTVNFRRGLGNNRAGGVFATSYIPEGETVENYLPQYHGKAISKIKRVVYKSLIDQTMYDFDIDTPIAGNTDIVVFYVPKTETVSVINSSRGLDPFVWEFHLLSEPVEFSDGTMLTESNVDTLFAYTVSDDTRSITFSLMNTSSVLPIADTVVSLICRSSKNSTVYAECIITFSGNYNELVAAS